MCTVTVIHAGQREARIAQTPLLRLVCNRDESRTRPLAEGVVRRRLGSRVAIMPTDPQSGGTWGGANDAGLVACLLNANPPGVLSAATGGTARESRGTIIPALLAATDPAEARVIAGAVDASRFPPFRALVLDAETFFIASSDGVSLRLAETRPIRGPIFLASSGLGDRQVQLPRRLLFDEFLNESRDPFDAQRRFHEHRWPDRPHLSVLMNRADARTVSRTVVELFPDAASLSYAALSERPTADAPAVRAELPLLRPQVFA